MIFTFQTRLTKTPSALLHCYKCFQSRFACRLRTCNCWMNKFCFLFFCIQIRTKKILSPDRKTSVMPLFDQIAKLILKRFLMNKSLKKGTNSSIVWIKFKYDNKSNLLFKVRFKEVFCNLHGRVTGSRDIYVEPTAQPTNDAFKGMIV